MKLPFETWLESSEVPSEADVAYRESVISYKAGAYRAGLLFAYVGTGLWLRRRLIAATCPAGIPAGQWAAIQRDLQDDNKWDATVFDCTQMRAPKDIFSVNDHVRDEFKYWKNRRNDCAHFKSNIIAASHVESFWLFLQSSIGRWVPNGSAQDLIERLARHFDPNLTPPGTDVGPLVALVPHAVPHAELPGFFDSLETRFTRTLGTFAMVNRDALIHIHEAILRGANAVAAPASITWLLGHPDILVGVLRKNASHVLSLSGRATEIRKLWRTQLFDGGHQDLGVVAALLRNNLIPSAELAEAIETTVGKLNGDIPSAIDEPVLAARGFWSRFHDHAVVNRQMDKFEWGNRNAGLIAWRVQNAPIDRETAEAICGVFSCEPYPFTVRDALKEMLAGSPAKMSELQAAATQAGTSVPSVLT